MKLLTVREVADLLKAKPSTVYAWAEQDLIPHCKLNGLLRFVEGDLHEWIINKKQEKTYNSSIGRKPRKGGQN